MNLILKLSCQISVNDNNNDDNIGNSNNDNNNQIERRSLRYFTVSLQRYEVARAQSCANQVQHIRHLSSAAFRVPCGTKGQFSY